MALPNPPHKVYVLLPVDEPVDATITGLSYVTGFAYRQSWATANPSEDVYDWTLIDAWVAAASANSKKITVYVGPINGVFPDWVLAQTRQFHFIDSDGLAATVPVPWDKFFLQAWYKFIKAIGARYINETVITAFRGSTDMLSNGWNLPSTDVNGKPWSKYGWKETGGLRFWKKQHIMFETMKASLNAWIGALPNHWHWVAQGTFPFESDCTGRAGIYIPKEIANYAVKIGYGGPWRENLSGCVADTFSATPPSQWEVPCIHFGKSGSQMVWNVQDLGAGKRMNPCGLTPNDKGTVMTAAINKGINFGNVMLEIYRIDVKDSDSALRTAITNANTSL